MERVNYRRKLKADQVERVYQVMNGLLASMNALTLRDSPIRENGGPPRVTEFGSVSCTLDKDNARKDSGDYPYRHGNPATAIHESLRDLYYPPFASSCLVIIDGEEGIYSNDLFAQLWYSSEEAMYRLRVKKQIPRRIIAE